MAQLIRVVIPKAWSFPWLAGVGGQLAAVNAWMAANPRNFGTEVAANAGRNPLYQDLMDSVFMGAEWKRQGQWAGCFVEESWLADDILELVEILGGNVQGLPLFYEIIDPAVSIPVGLPGSNNGANAWSDFYETHPLRELGGKYYVMAAKNMRGDPIDWSTAKALNDSNDANVRVIRVTEMKAIIDANPSA